MHRYLIAALVVALLAPALTAQVSWTQQPAAPWATRSGHATAVFNNRLWILGGYVPGGYKSDVWSSPDGANWTLETAAAPWPARERHSAPPTSAVVGAGYSYQPTASGMPAPTFTVSGLPAWLTFNPVTGETFGTPTQADTGQSPVISLTATNVQGTDVQDIQITVSAAPAVPPAPLSVAGGKGDAGCAAGTGAAPFVLALLLAARRRRKLA